MDGVTAYQEEDGDLTSQITYTGTWDVNVDGVYVINYRVEDSRGQEATGRRILVVDDGSFYVGDYYIIQARDFTRRVSEVDTSHGAVISAAQSRAWSADTGELTTVRVDNLGGYTNVVGAYNITFAAGQGTETVRTTIVATVIDDDGEEVFRLRFDPNGGVGSKDYKVIETGDIVNLPTNTFTKEAHVFIGWSYEPDGEVEFLNEEIVEVLEAQNVTLYAQWEEGERDLEDLPEAGNTVLFIAAALISLAVITFALSKKLRKN
jgi:hypothetical protein